MKVLFIYPAFNRHAQDHPELLEFVPMNEYLGSPSLGIATMAAVTPGSWEIEFRDDRLEDATRPTDADIVALSFFTPAARRALAIADHFRAEGKVVVAGGIFPTAMPDVVAEHVDAVVVGEGEHVWPQALRDFAVGRLRSRYANEASIKLDDLPLPRLDLYFAQERGTFQPDDYPLQISRGCALACAACILPLSMTRHQRPLAVDHVMAQLDVLQSAGKRACLTEDTSWFPGPRGRGLLEQVLDRIIESGRPAPISYVGISMPMILSTPMSFLQKAREAGIDMFYLVGGFDPITRGAFTTDNPRMRQKAIDAVQKSLDAGIEPYTSFLFGDDQDDEGTPDRMLEVASIAGIRKAEFAISTPYPATPQWHRLLAEDRILTVDWSKYNDANIVFRPRNLTPEQVTDGYLYLWKNFYASRPEVAEMSTYERTIQF